MADDIYGDDNPYLRRSTIQDVEPVSDIAPQGSVLSTSTGFGALSDPTFLAEMREYYANKGDYFNTNEEMIEKFYSDQTWNNMNTVALANNVDEAFSADGRQRQLMIRMMDVYDSLPNFYQEDGRGMEGLWANIWRAAVDPVNLVGFGAGGAAAREVIRQGGKGAIKAGIKRGALTEGAVSGVVEGGFNSLEQVRDIELGLQDGYSVGEAAMAAGTGAVLGGTLGGAFGAAGAALQRAGADETGLIGRLDETALGRAGLTPTTIAKQNRQLRALGYTDADIAEMNNPLVEGTIKNQIARADSVFAQREAAELAELQGEQPEAEVDTQEGRSAVDRDQPVDLARIEAKAREAEQQLAAGMSSGDDVTDLAEAATTYRRLLELGEALNNYAEEIQPLLQSTDPRLQAQGRRRANELIKAKALYNAAFESGDEVDAARLRELMDTLNRKAEAEAEAEPPAEAVDVDEAPAAAPEEADAGSDTGQAVDEEPDDLSSISFTTTQVARTAQSRGLTAADFAGRTASSKSGKFSAKDINAISKEKGALDAPEEAAITPEEVAEAAAPEEMNLSTMQITEVKYNTDGQRESIEKILNSAGMDEDDLADLVESGLIPVNESGVLVQKKAQTALRKYIKDRNLKKTDNADLQKLADEQLGEFRAAFGEERFASIAQHDEQTFRYIIEQQAPERGDEIADMLLEQFNNGSVLPNVLPSNGRFGDLTSSFTTSQKKLVRERKKVYVEEGQSDMAAEAMAIADVLQAIRRRNQRTDDTPIRSALSDEPTETTAGRTTQGRIQSFLRAGTDIGDGYSIIGADPKVVRADTPDYDKVIQGYQSAVDIARQTRMQEVEQNGKKVMKEVEVRPIVRYQSTGGERVYGTGEGSFESRPDGKKKFFRQAKAKMGEVLYVDYRGRAYRDPSFLKEGTVNNGQPINHDAKFVPEKSKLLNLGEQLRAGEISMDEYMRAMSTVSTDAVTKEAKAPDLPDVPVINNDGQRLAIMPTDESIPVRVLSKRQEREGKGLADLVGRMSPEEYTVGYVHGSASTGSKLATDTFEEFVQADIDEPRAFLTQHEASQQRVTVDVDEFRQLVDMAQGLDFGDYAIEMGDVPTSLRKMQEMLNVLHRVNWWQHIQGGFA